jgi:hypothetical protein
MTSTGITRVGSPLGNINWVGKLTLEYYTGVGNNNKEIKIIPFFENPTIVESQNPRYMNYATVGRASNLFAYLGSDSRKFNISFKLNIPHITDMMKQYSYLWNTPPTKQQKQKEILQKTADSGNPFVSPTAKKGLDWINQMQKGYQGVAAEFDEEFDKRLLEGERNLQQLLSFNSPMYNKNSEGSNLRRTVINRISSMVASIRSTVINNAINPEFGPPLVRLDWGILFRNVPCVCKGYTLNVNDKSGYDKRTLLPRVLDVTMNLEEARSLNVDVERIQSDDLIGWEVLLGTEAQPGSNMDPGNYSNWSAVYED